MGRPDREIRAPLAAWLQEEGPTDLLCHELSIPRGAADVAVIGTNTIEGYEIKSAPDTISRLKHQIPSYNAVFTHCVLVTTYNHLQDAVAQLPSWWGIMLYAPPDRFTIYRHADPNPSPLPANLLWAPEIRALCHKLGLWREVRARDRATFLRNYPTGKYRGGVPCKGMCLAVLREHPGVCPVEEISRILKARPNWRLADGRTQHAHRLQAEREATRSRVKQKRR